MEYDPVENQYVFRVDGECPICEGPSSFIAKSVRDVEALWLPHLFRGELACTGCGSVPRERALCAVLQKHYPNWRALNIHESSPIMRGLSLKLSREAPGYIATQYDPALGFGNTDPQNRYRSEDLERQTFPDEAFDLVVTQDVFEHLFNPGAAIREIERTLRPGGAHIFTVPIVNGCNCSVRRARISGGDVEHLLEPQYHGNPMSPRGSLVTVDWGYDILAYLTGHSGLMVAMFDIDDLGRGIRAAFNEVLMARKSGGWPDI